MNNRIFYIIIVISLIVLFSTGCSDSTTQDYEACTVSTDYTATVSSLITTTSTTGNYSIVDTNQTLCYNSSTGVEVTCIGTGYDADYTSANQPSYTVSGSGDTVLDNVTGLTWTQSSDLDSSTAVDYADKKYQSDAVTYCDNLDLDGITDWRLPDVKTAYSLILFSGKDASSYTGSDTSSLTLFIDTTFDKAFGDTTAAGITAGDRIIDAQYATASIYESTTMHGDNTMFGVNYVDGRIKGYPTTIKKYYVRCVSGNTNYGLNNFTDNGDETISDTATGLMWHKNDSSSTNWDDAISICENDTTGGKSDWRLPNAKELNSIVDYSRSPDTSNGPAINSVFNSTSFTNEECTTDWEYYWSSTTHANDTGDGKSATYQSFGRALGYFNGSILDVHGAGAQRSNYKNLLNGQPGVSSIELTYGLFYYKGPQGDILRLDNKVKCVRTIP